jgi:hypothetical protein
MIMNHHLFRWTLLGLAGLAVTASGCSRWIDILPSPAQDQESVTRSIPDSERVPFVMDGFRLTQNGAPRNPSPELERRILNSVQETHLFSTLMPLAGTGAPLGEKVVTARIAFDEVIDPHPGEAAWKGFVIGASMFLLSPVIDLNYDYAAQASLELERWDGQVKRYEARSAGAAHYHLFGATPIMIDELKGRVTEACLNQLITQLVQDTGLYMAGSAPLPDSPIRSITVKARNPVAPPSAHSPLPVSTVPAP